MADDNKCAHDLCQCARGENSNYCSQYCELADDQDLTEILCGVDTRVVYKIKRLHSMLNEAF